MNQKGYFVLKIAILLLVISSFQANSATIKWGASPTSGVTYNLYMGDFDKPIKTEIKGTIYTDKSLDNTNKFAVSASKNGEESPLAYQVNVVPPEAPSNVVVVDIDVDVKVRLKRR